MLSTINKYTKGTKEAISNKFLLFGPIETEMSMAFSEWLITNNELPVEEKPEFLDVFINSVGGSLHDAWVIIDMIEGSDIPVRTIGTGMIASGGLLIFMSGQRGSRIITENCSVMSHQFATDSGNNKYHELQSSYNEYNNIQKRLIKHICKCTDLSQQEILTELMPPSDVWLTAQQTVKLGMADKVANLK